MRAIRTWSRQQQILAAGALVVVAAVVLGWLFWPSEPEKEPIRERQYKNATACLLTDDKGINGDLAKAAWAGMQEASTAKLIKVQNLSISGPQTAANGLSFYNTLGVQKCTLIIAAGDVPVAAMLQGYQQFPDIRHVAIGGEPRGAAITVIGSDSPSTIQADVKRIVADTA